jgi:hypothetical protein
MFIEKRDHGRFSWVDLGDIETGRPHLGPMVPVLVYRLLQYTLRDVLIQEINAEKAKDCSSSPGRMAGTFFPTYLTETAINDSRQLQALKNLKMESYVWRDRLRESRYDPYGRRGPDCSGLPLLNAVVCVYYRGSLRDSQGLFGREFSCTGSG